MVRVILVTMKTLLILDLDQTLVYVSQDTHRHNFYVGCGYYAVIRPHWFEFRRELSSVFEFGIYTSAPKWYAERIVLELFGYIPDFFNTIEDCTVQTNGIKKEKLPSNNFFILDDIPEFYDREVIKHHYIPTFPYTGSGWDTFLKDGIPYLLEKI